MIQGQGNQNGLFNIHPVSVCNKNVNHPVKGLIDEYSSGVQRIR